MIDTILDTIYPLPTASNLKIQACITTLSLPKGTVLIREGKIEPFVYFIKTGIVRAFSSRSTEEITFWFGREMDTIISMKSYVNGEPGYESIQLLEDCELYQIATEDLQQLFATDIHIANWGRKFAEQELIKTEERLISRQFKTAQERYNELLQHNADLLQRVQLGHIASYLGITQVSLSRIRAAKQ